MKITKTLRIGVFLVMGFGSFQVGASNMVTNGGFESVDGSNHPTDWAGPVIYTNGVKVLDYTHDAGGGNTVAISVDNTVYHEGNQSLKMVVTGTSRQAEFLGNSVSLQTGKNYSLRYWMKTDSLTTTGNGPVTGLRYSYPPGAGWSDGTKITFKGTRDWTYCEETFKWAAGTSTVWPTLSHNQFSLGAGTVWFDDVQFSQVVPYGISDVEEVGLWLLDGNVLDETTNTHRTAFISSTSYTNEVPNIRAADYASNRSIVLNGVNNYVHIDGVEPLHPANITVEAWVKPVGAIQGGVNPIVYSYDGYNLGLTEVGGTHYAVHVNLRTSLAPNYWAGIMYSSPEAKFTPGAWHKIGFTYDGALITLYLDGQPIKSKAWTGTVTGQNQWARIGNGGDSHYFRGLVDEVSILPRALSAAEILKGYSRSRVFVAKGTVIVIR